MSCKKKKEARPKVFELKFMNLCTEGCYRHPEMLDNLWEDAVGQGKEQEILEAKDDSGDSPLHKTAENGRPTVMNWIFNKWKEQGLALDVNKKNSDGYTPLFHCCLKGFLGNETVAGKSQETKICRLECVKMLHENGADVNF